MKNRTTTLMLSGAIGLFLCGCAATSPTMRGQSPGDYGNCHGSCDSGHECPMCDSGFTSAGMEMDKVRGRDRRDMKKADRQMRRDCRGCNGVGCDQCLNLPFHPVHRNFQTFSAPQGLSYPQQDTPPATYQYPYYTFRGPTDFFMK